MTTLAYKLSLGFGDTLNQHKPVLVLLHGFLGSTEEWQPLMNSLADDYRCVAIDLPGHGQSAHIEVSPRPSEDGFGYCCRLIKKSLNQLNIQQYQILGYSLGGRIAMHLALNDSSSITRLYLESANPGLPLSQRAQRIANDQKWLKILTTQSMVAFLNLWYQQPVFANLNEEARNKMIAERAKNRAINVAKIYQNTGLGLQQDLRPALAKLEMPVHFFSGQQDVKFFDIGVELSNKRIANSHHHFDCGHNIHKAQFQPFIDTIKSIASNP